RALSESVGVTIRLEANGTDTLLTSQAELALYRITQEAISNAVRHSGAGHVLVEIENGPDSVCVTVRDDGRGFAVEQVMGSGQQGLGLFGMQERAAYVGGRVEIRSRPGRGTTVRAEVPVAHAAVPR